MLAVCTAMTAASGGSAATDMARDDRLAGFRPIAQHAQPHRFDIPAGPLGAALAMFGDIARLKLLVPSDIVRDRRTAGVSGSFTPEQALQLLLAGTGLAYRFSGDAVTVERMTDGATPMPPVTTEALRETAWGPVRGYVAKRSAAGTKTDTPIIETPQAISVVTRDQMDMRNVQREGEAFRYTAGIYAEPYGGDPRPSFDAPYIRGFDQSTTAVYRDGLRENRGIWAGFISEFYGLERVDVLKGPASVIYGQGNPGGIINKITKRPPDEAFGEVLFQHGTNDRYQGAFDVGGPIDNGKDFRYRVTGLARESGSQFRYDDNDSVPDNRKYFAPAITWRATEDTTLTLQADYLHNLTAGPFTVTGAGPTATSIMLGEPEFNRSDLSQYSGSYGIDHRVDDVWSLRQNLRYGVLNFEYRNMTATGTSSNGRILNRAASIIDENLDALTVDNQAEARFTLGPVAQTLLMGIDYQRVYYHTRTRSGTGPSLNLINPTYGQVVTVPKNVTTDSRQSRYQFGLYAQDQIKLDDRVVWTVGARHDWATALTENRRTGVNAEQDDREMSFRTGLTYLFDSGVAPYVSYTQSFLPTAGTDFGGTPFEPTIGRQVELGVKWQPKSVNGTVTAAVYDLRQTNVLTPDPLRPNSAFRVQTGEVRSRGFELEGIFEVVDGLNLIAAVSLQDIEITKDNPNAQGISTTGNRPAWAANHVASIWSDYTIQSGEAAGLTFGAGARYVGPTFADNANTVKNESYTLVDAVVRYDLGQLASHLDGMSVAVNANNLFDKEYVICTATTSCTLGLSRTVIGTVKYRW
jgi:iron complex outermembrane recepter protein